MELDLKAIQAAAVAGLPNRARWMVGDTPLDFDFAQARRGLRRLTTGDVGGAIAEEWSNLLVFGDLDYADGGGAWTFIVVRTSDGAVCELHADREGDEAIFVFNSSIGRFVLTFAELDLYLRRGQRLPADIEARVRSIDPRAYPASEWRLLIEHAIAE
jgi:hypothetical protein